MMLDGRFFRPLFAKEDFMSIIVNGISVRLDSDDDVIKHAAAAKLGVRAQQIKRLRVKRQSIDARRENIRLVMTALVDLFDVPQQQALEIDFGKAQEYCEPSIRYGSMALSRPVVIGTGPCGLFAALTLAKHGYRPLVLERGKNMAEREADVGHLMRTGIPDSESNVCFGAGGAGAFSDGKLTSRIKDPRAEHVLQTLADFGAPEQILRIAHPHTGTEYIRKAVRAMLAHIELLGGEILFSSRFCGILADRQALCGIRYMRNGTVHIVETRAALLCIGHSARDTYEMLLEAGIAMEPKPFAVGLRIEHLRAYIDKTQYGAAYGHPMLGAAEYRLAAKHGGRSVYTFCMCPGGVVINSSTQPEGIAVNGMSYYARDGENSNSAVVVSVAPADFPKGALGGMAFAQHIERAAFTLCGKSGIPVQTVGGFSGGSGRFGSVSPSIRPHPAAADLNRCLPPFIADAIKGGLAAFGQKLKGFDNADAVLTGVETRTSSPVRIRRREDFQAETLGGLYPAGEGAGYAGGIVSAATDGIKCAEALMHRFAPPS